jgi:hypothetical protein
MSKINLVLCHTGNLFPEYIFQCIYQAYYFNKQDISIYLLTNKKFVSPIYNQISKWQSSNLMNVFTVIPVEQLELESAILQQFKQLKGQTNNFREGFWIHTTARFIYIYEFMKTMNLENVFHIENDVMIYSNLRTIFIELQKQNMTNKLITVQDHPKRSICSIVFIPKENNLESFLQFSLEKLKVVEGLNDMELMGAFNDKHTFPDSPEHPLAKSLGIFDGAALGQYLGGIDLRNINSSQNNISPFENPTVGFINETAIFKPNTCEYKYNGQKWVLLKDNIEFPIHCLHIHSKQLYNFNSSLNLCITDIITGDRILDLVDIIITTNDIIHFHKFSLNYISKLLSVKDFNNINTNGLREFINRRNTKPIKIFVYTHLLEQFFEKVLKFIDCEIVLYTHNSDHAVDNKFSNCIDSPKILKMYSQNLNTIHPKVQLLPIGIANNMWPHGDLNSLYKTIIETYNHVKTKNIYVNINPKTYPYRKIILESLDNSFVISKSKDYKDYLFELSQHRFSLCVRGNGIDTHRFWESLYLGVIPVIIVNKETNCFSFVNNLRLLGIPFYEIESIEHYNSEEFNENLYRPYREKLIRTKHLLKISNYQ